MEAKGELQLEIEIKLQLRIQLQLQLQVTVHGANNGLNRRCVVRSFAPWLASLLAYCNSPTLRECCQMI